MSWLKEHLETFVKPYLLSSIHTGVREDTDMLKYFKEKTFTPVFSKEEMILIKAIWRSVKQATRRSGKTLLLTGRDTFVFEILARRENFPTLFIPECSRVTKLKFLHLDTKKYLLFDTGFEGSIPKTLGMEHILLSHIGCEQGVMIFPNLKSARDLAYKIEHSPKYWESARLVNGEIMMNISNIWYIELVAKLTVDIYTDSTPMAIVKPKVTSRPKITHNKYGDKLLPGSLKEISNYIGNPNTSMYSMLKAFNSTQVSIAKSLQLSNKFFD
jgi:hypothetical protein